MFHTTLPASGRKVGGVEVFVHRLASSLVELGFDTEVISLDNPPPGAIYASRRLFGRFPFLRKYKILRLTLLPFLLNFCNFKNYDVVHFHGDDWFYFVRPVPSIRSFYGSALFESRSARSLKRKMMMRVVYAWERLAGRLADVVVGVGAEASTIYNADAVAKLFISNSTFFPGEKSKDPTCVFVGHLEGRKRGRFVADIFINQVLPRCANAKLLMACDSVPVHESIVDLQHPSDEKLAEAIRSAWALLSASTYEGFGIPYLEAIASGTVVITTRNSGAEFVLGEGEHKAGFIVSDAAYSDTVVEVIKNAELRHRYESLGLARAREFAERKVIDEHIDYYRLAINRFYRRSSEK
jgi:glycosyltransferase involved in cell wall biosynthesis